MQRIYLYNPLFLDTNILQYFINKSFGNAFIFYLDKLKLEYSFAISSITIYELLRGVSKNKEINLLKFINTFEKYEVTDQILRNAAQLESLYKLEGIMANQIEQGDKFIAATAILTNSCILTANARDFPHPYFIEVERRLLEFEITKKRFKSIVTSLLRPDIEVINKRIQEIPQQ